MATSSFVDHGGAAFGNQVSLDNDITDKIVLSNGWREFCRKLGDAMLVLAQADPQPDDHSLLTGDPDRGVPPPGDYKAHYSGGAELWNDHYHAYLSNDKRNAIWVETGTHPGGNPANYVPGTHVMSRAMEAAFRIVTGV